MALLACGACEKQEREDSGAEESNCEELYECILEECDSQLELGSLATEKCAIAACGEFSTSLAWAAGAAATCAGDDQEGCESYLNMCFDSET